MTDLARQSLQAALVKAEASADWTDLFDKSAVIKQANRLIDELVFEIHARQLPIHDHLSAEELALLYRFPIHVGVNIFVERLLRIAHAKEMGLNRAYPNVSYQHRYFRDTDESVMTYYYDFSINYDLLYSIDKILGGSVLQDALPETEQPRPQDALINRPISLLESAKRNVKRTVETYVKLSKPDVVGEYSNWMREILPFGQMHSFSYPSRNYLTDKTIRGVIRDCCRKVFLGHIDSILGKLEREEKTRLAEIFAGFIDHIIPQSVVEGLTERFSYFQKMIKGWNVKQVHSFIGYYYSENFKVFAILARRKGAQLVGHAHGASNPVSSYKHCRNELAFLDFYFTWGIKNTSWMRGCLNHEELKMINLGSTYLSTVKPRVKRKIDSSKMTMLFPSGPMMDFMGDLQEITPERNYVNRVQTLFFLKELRKTYPGLRILYKPFPGTFTNDPIKTLFADEFCEGSVRLVQEKPSALYHIVDMVLWETISTGFCESIASGIPTLVFQSREEYELSAPRGRELDDMLMACGMLFHDIKSGLRFFDQIVRDLDGFIASRRDTVLEFQETTGYPVSKKKFLTMFSKATTQNT